MKLPRFLRRRKHRAAPERPTTPGQVAATSALERSQVARRQGKEQGPTVTEYARRLRHLRERNHFAEMIRTALEGDH